MQEEQTTDQTDTGVPSETTPPTGPSNMDTINELEAQLIAEKEKAAQEAAERGKQPPTVESLHERLQAVERHVFGAPKS